MWGPLEEGDAEGLDLGMGIVVAEQRIKLLAYKRETRGEGSAGVDFWTFWRMFKVAALN